MNPGYEEEVSIEYIAEELSFSKDKGVSLSTETSTLNPKSNFFRFMETEESEMRVQEHGISKSFFSHVKDPFYTIYIPTTDIEKASSDYSEIFDKTMPITMLHDNDD